MVLWFTKSLIEFFKRSMNVVCTVHMFLALDFEFFQFAPQTVRQRDLRMLAHAVTGESRYGVSSCQEIIMKDYHPLTKPESIDWTRTNKEQESHKIKINLPDKLATITMRPHVFRSSGKNAFVTRTETNNKSTYGLHSWLIMIIFLIFCNQSRYQYTHILQIFSLALCSTAMYQ